MIGLFQRVSVAALVFAGVGSVIGVNPAARLRGRPLDPL